MKLRAHEVGEAVISPAVGVNRPEHGPDQTGVSLGFTEFILGSGRGLAGDQVIHRLPHNRGRGVAREETDRYFISR